MHKIMCVLCHVALLCKSNNDLPNGRLVCDLFLLYGGSSTRDVCIVIVCNPALLSAL